MRDAGNIGGSLGLLIGASVITLFEAVDAFAITLARKKRRPQRQPNQEAENEIWDICPRTDTYVKLGCSL